MMHVQNKTICIDIVVVLYKLGENQSNTLATLAAISSNSSLLSESRLIIWDNSPKSLGRMIGFTGLRNVLRIYTPENKSLSGIYNYCANESEGMDALCILDQDTNVTYAYFSELIDAMRDTQGVQCFIPLVCAKTTGVLISPGSLFVIKGKYWVKPRAGEIASKNVLAIASGMTIRTSYLATKLEPFDTRLNLYGIDTKFMIDYAKVNPTVYVLKACLIHGHSSSEIETVEMKLFRFLNWKGAWRIINSESLFKRWGYELYAFYRSARYAIRYNNLGFFRQND